MILAPMVRGRKGEYKKELEKLARQGFVRARIDGDAAAARRRDHARPAQEPHHRGRGRPAADQAGYRRSGWKHPSRPPPSWPTAW